MLIGAGIGIPFQQNVLARLLGSAEFFAPLTHSAIPTRAAFGTTGTFTRATTSTWQNNDGYMVTGVAGEIGFPGARRVRNLLTFTEDFSNAAWTLINGGTGSAPTKTPNYAEAPDGTTTACRVTATRGAGNTASDYSGMRIVITGATGASKKYLRHVWAKSNTGSSQVVNLQLNSAAEALTVTTEWTQILDDATSTNGNFDVGSYGGTGANANIDILIWHPQVEDPAAQTTQTAGEYVSVGALDYRSELNPLYLSLPGTNGNCATTPDSVSTSPTGDIELIFDGAATDWTPTADQVLICKDDAGIQRDILLFLRLATARVELWTSATGASYAGRAASATAALPFADGQRGQIKVTRSAATGDTNFYTSTDGSTWTQLGTTVSTTAGAIHDGTAALTIGALGDASKTIAFGGKVYSATLASSIGGAPVVDFNPHRDAVTPTGTFTSSTTGEVWTINGASSVIRSDYYHRSFVDGVKCFPTDLSGNPIPAATMLGYQAEGARTNLCLQSNAFTTTWSGAATPVQNVVGPGGATSAWTITDASAVALQTITQAITLTAATYTFSVFVKKTVGATTFPIIYATNAAAYALATIDTNNGVATVWTSNGYGTTPTSSATCISYNANFWRVSLTFLATAVAWNPTIAPAATTNATQSSGVADVTAQGSAVFANAQVELGSFASSYIPTTTAAVTRNADVLTYSSAGNISDTAGWAYAEYSSPAMTLLNAMAVVGDGGGTNRGPLITRTITSGAHMFDGTNLNAGAAGAPLNNVILTAASTWGGVVATVGVDGVLGTQGPYDGSYGLTSLGIGYGAVNFFGTIRDVRIGQRQLSASEMQAVTS